MYHFYFPYIGGKCREIKYIMDLINSILEEITIVVEPFCGSSALSLSLFLDHKQKKKYHVNDTDLKLIEFLKDVKKNGSKRYIDFVNKTNKNFCKDVYTKIKKKYLETGDLLSYFYYMKIYGIRRGLCPPESRINANIDYTKYIDTDRFFKKTMITSFDYNQIFEKYIDNEKAFLFLDPPYFDSFNGFYIDFKKTAEQKKIMIDNTKMFIDILKFIKTCKCKVILIINKNAITSYIFRNFIKGEYDKTYQLTKKKTMHLIVSNI